MARLVFILNLAFIGGGILLMTFWGVRAETAEIEASNLSPAGSGRENHLPLLVKAFRLFIEHDTNLDGNLDSREMANIGRAKARTRMAVFDSDKDGVIRKSEFRAVAISLLKERAANIPDTFLTRFDADRDGTITLDEMKKAGGSQSLLGFFACLDHNGDRRLSPDELNKARAIIIGLTLKPRVAKIRELQPAAHLTANTSEATTTQQAFIRFLIDMDENGVIDSSELETFLLQTIGEKAAPYALGKVDLQTMIYSSHIASPPNLEIPASVSSPTPPHQGPPRNFSLTSPSLPASTAMPNPPSRMPLSPSPTNQLAAKHQPTVNPASQSIGFPPKESITPLPKAPHGTLKPPLPPPREILFPQQSEKPSSFALELAQDLLTTDVENDFLW